MDVYENLNECLINITDTDILDRLIDLSSYYNLDSSDISSKFANYLFSKSIQDDNVNLSVIESFEKEVLVNDKTTNRDFITKSPAVKNLKRKIILDELDLGQYCDDTQIDDTDSNINNSLNQSIVSDTNFVVESSNVYIDENIDPLNESKIWPITLLNSNSKYEYMHQIPSKVLNALETNSLNIIEERLKQRNATLSNESNHIHIGDMDVVTKINQDILICGRIVIDHSNTPIVPASETAQDIVKLTHDNIAIQGLSSMQLATVPLNLEQTLSYSFFPGQNVILKGSNSSKTGFVISEVLPAYAKQCLPINRNELCSDLRALIASGPFYMKNANDNSLFKKMFASLTNEKCNLLILIGPFVDTENEMIQKRLEVDLYSTILNDELLKVAKHCIAHNVPVIFVPSTIDECHTDNVFPQPKYEVPAHIAEFNHPLVHFADNPAFFKVGPISFGVTSADIILHLSRHEIHKRHTNTSGFKRRCQHLLHENNFYPLKSQYNDLNIDWCMWPKCDFGDNVPHCLIVPSAVSCFKENVDGVFCVNPGHVVTTANHSGTFSILTVTQSKFSSQYNTNSIIPAVECKFVRF